MNTQPTTTNRLLGAITGVLLMFMLLLAAELIKDKKTTPNLSNQHLSIKKATYEVAEVAKTLKHPSGAQKTD
ncbi:hypothetical protein [Microscilla marina]|uniref:Uncharacterized protein n=1 Tax=Microscilla marina ATCC 23134 TaxID=313606 RepID=A1ZJT5_MICM2|nr:hypothetical protein [Microscilla marina]EAY29388.1 hypothetical protein M23134_01444 [Microscilla marina ATCC 23134]